MQNTETKFTKWQIVKAWLMLIVELAFISFITYNAFVGKDIGAQRIVGFFTWFFAILSLIYLDPKHAKDIAEIKVKINPIVNFYIVFILICVHVYHGWLNTAFALIILFFAMCNIDIQRDKIKKEQKDSAKELESNQ